MSAEQSRYYTFSDYSDTSGYAVNAMIWATDVGVFNGDNGFLFPKGTATRAQVAAIFMNAQDLFITGGNAIPAENPYVGIYKNNQEEYREITVSEDGTLQWLGRDIDLENVQEDGSILALKIEQGPDIAPICMYIYPVGVELFVYDNNTFTEVESDKSKIRLFFTYSDVPDINYSVYYKTE